MIKQHRLLLGLAASAVFFAKPPKSGSGGDAAKEAAAKEPAASAEPKNARGAASTGGDYTPPENEAGKQVEPTSDINRDMRLGPDGEGPVDIAGENIPGDPALNNAGGLAEREMESTADRDVRAAAQSTRTALALSDKLGLKDGGDEDPFELMDRFSRITAGPRYARNQTFAQIRLTWGSAAAGARSFQERIDKRIDRAAEKQAAR